MLTRIKHATLLLVAFTCATYYTVVTEAEGSSGATWAKALPAAHISPSESECQPYIEKAIKKLSDNTKDETVEIEKDTNDLESYDTFSTIEANNSNNDEEQEDNRSMESSSSEAKDGRNAFVNTGDELLQLLAEDTNQMLEDADNNTSKDDSDEKKDGNEIDTNMRNKQEEERENENSDSNEESIKENEARNVNIRIIEADTNSDEIQENNIDSTEENQSPPSEQQSYKMAEKIKENKNKEDKDEKESDNDKDESDEENIARANDDNDEESEADDDKNYKRTVKVKRFIPKKRKMAIAKIIKDKKLKKDIKEEDEDDDDDDNDEKNDAAEEEPDKREENDEFDAPEEELTKNQEIPKELRDRKHVVQILQLETDENSQKEKVQKLIESTLKELKKLYEIAIKPLEVLYKYRDLSNRHFGDAEIFSKPLILFMGPWSGGKSTIINYLLENEFKETSLRTGAEPSPAYFNILMWGENETVLDGTQLAADWTFSGLQKFGQGLLDRLRGLQMPHPLLQKVNIVEIPGILEIRKQVERLFPFNDACQWFIDRADIIFLVYDPSKLDVGPETEAILDQLKGREYQTRIILNKADQVKAEELMRVQGTLIWNISPLMSSIEPPVMYTTSLWSMPYEKSAPTRLLHSQEVAFLKDLQSAIHKRVENKIASARRFAVRVRNHAKMVDCYLTTYYNHKSFFGNRKKVNDDIVERPQNYHIYEGLSTLTNISRYDLPDPDVYRDFFRLHPIYEFQRLSDTCTYFRGCPINRLDIAIAYDLPELIGKYKKSMEHLLSTEGESSNTTNNKKTT